MSNTNILANHRIRQTCLAAVWLTTAGCVGPAWESSDDPDALDSAHQSSQVQNREAALAIASVQPSVFPLDSDGDGWSDQAEIARGSNPYGADTLTAPSAELRTDATRAAVATDSRGNLDQDGDGVSNLKEFYGYYYNPFDGEFLAVDRRLTRKQWCDFTNRPDPLATNSAQANRVTPEAKKGGDKGDKCDKGGKGDKGAKSPWKLAGDTLATNGFRQPYGEDYRVLLEGSALALEEAFVEEYGLNHVFVVSGATVEGSWRNVLFELSQYQLIMPVINGESVTPSFSDPGRFSSDHDPYGDGEEVSGVNMPLVVPPANHPLISGYPVIEARLTSYRTTTTVVESVSEGTDRSREWTSSTATSIEQTTGWDIETSATVGGSLLEGPSASVSTTVGVHGSTTHSETKTVGEGAAISHNFAIDTEVDQGCAGRLALAVELANTGFTHASNIETSIDIYLNGSDPIYTYTPSFDLDLPVGASRKVALPDATDDPDLARGFCLSVPQMRYMDGGGAVRIEAFVKDATIAFFNSQDKRLEEDGDWTTYLAQADATSARVIVDSVDARGRDVSGSFLVYAGETPALSLQQALDLSLDVPSCPAQGVCRDNGGHIEFSADTQIAFMPRDQQGRYSLDEALDHLPAASPDGTKLSANEARGLTLRPRWVYHIVTPRSVAPRVVSAVAERDGDGRITVSATATDAFGIADVEFCQRDVCYQMPLQDLDGDQTSQAYVVTLDSLEGEFTGEEFVRAINTRGQSSPEFPVGLVEPVEPPQPQLPPLIPIYEYIAYNPTRFHMSTSPNVGYGWTRHRVAFRAAAEAHPNMVPVYQYHASNPVWRFTYSTNPNLGYGWTRDAVVFYVPETSNANTIPVYQHYQAHSWGWVFRAAPEQNISGWPVQKTAFHAYPAEP